MTPVDVGTWAVTIAVAVVIVGLIGALCLFGVLSFRNHLRQVIKYWRN